MNPICDFCQNKKWDSLKSRFVCDAAIYQPTDHGVFKRGCVCIYDSDLSDDFVPVENVNDITTQLIKNIQNLEQEKRNYRDRIHQLERRLLE